MFRYCECHSPNTTELEIAIERLSEWNANGRPSMSLKDYMKKNGVKTTDSEDWEGIRAAIDVKPHEQFGKVDTWALDVAIKELLTAARESALREALEEIRGVFDSHKNKYPRLYQDYYEMGIHVGIDTLTARLLDT